MPDTRASALTALGGAPVSTDLLFLVDVSDTTMAASGTSKYMTIANLFASPAFTGQASVADGNKYLFDGASGSYSLRKGSTQGGGAIITECAGTDIFAVGQNSGVGTVNIGPYSFSTAISATADVFLYRDAAAVLALKNTTTAQTFRIYGNVTGSHYLNMTHNGTNAVLSVNGGGVLHISSLPTANPGAGILWNNGGTPAIGT